MSTADLTERDYYADQTLLLDPYEYFRQMYARGPVTRMAGSDVLLVSGFEEAVEVLRNNTDFSSVISTTGTGGPPPFQPVGSDVSGQIEAFRQQLGERDLLVAYDDKQHS
nr:hypothetical protein [Halioglobus sp.]